MILEETYDILIDSLTGLNYSYTTPQIVRYGEDVDESSGFVLIRFRPTNRKIGESLNNFISLRENKYYSNYGYGEYEHVTISCLAEKISGIDGRVISQSWMNTIESYIKNKWNIYLMNTGSVDEYSFGHDRFYNPFNNRQYVNQVYFDIITTNTWTDEPDTGAKSLYLITGVNVSGNINVWVT